MIKLGVDVGGTFTDLVVFDESSGKIELTKVASTPRSPDEGVLNGIRKLASQFAIELGSIDFFIHGTTVATNALIERKGVKIALLTTAGFRDVLHIGRQTRPKLYDFFERRPDPLVPRHLRFEVPERMLHTGAIHRALDEAAVRAIAEDIKRHEVGVIAVCLLHAYANPAHEQRVRDILLAQLPDLKVSISSDVLPEFKEYERMSTTVINAYVMPIVERYLQRIVTSLRGAGVNTGLNIMQSNGGVMTAEAAGQKSVHTVLSGPAAGVLGGIELSKMAGFENLITIDMGGTSFDVSLAHRGVPSFSTETDIGGHPIKIPMIDIKTLGAGGGSIARIDAGGALQVGPESAGADPGPVCYGRGAERPTVTDANVVLGYLNPQYFAGGDIRLDVERAREAIRKDIAAPMRLSVEDAAEGILRVVNATMIRGIRLVSVERGFDPRDFVLVCFGGAGPVHAVRLAQELNMPTALVPSGPGVTCALGLLMADFRHDYSRTFLARVRTLAPAALSAVFRAMQEIAAAQMLAEGVAHSAIVFHRAADMRYEGQGYELSVPLPNREYAAAELVTLTDELGRIHRDGYGYAMPSEAAEIVTVRLTAIGLRPKPQFRSEPLGAADARPALKGERRVYMDAAFHEIPVYERRLLRAGMQIAAPAIVEQFDSTTVLFNGYDLSVDSFKNLIIRRKG
jgi:N-methylhydantoinase A